jgi:hypothetical protein
MSSLPAKLVDKYLPIRSMLPCPNCSRRASSLEGWGVDRGHPGPSQPGITPPHTHPKQKLSAAPPPAREVHSSYQGDKFFIQVRRS